MNIFQKYIAYLNDNPSGYWFKRKPYGWGWSPARWPGFVVTGLYLTLVLFLALRIPASASEQVVLTEAVFPILGVSILFILIAWRTGESPKWMWHIPEPEKNDSSPRV